MGDVAAVGVHGGEGSAPRPGAPCTEATVVIGPRPAARRLCQRTFEAERVALTGPLAQALDDVAADRDRGERVCLVVSGDPGFFGLARLARARLASGGAGAASRRPPAGGPGLRPRRIGVGRRGRHLGTRPAARPGGQKWC